jgi:hypothetical protein
MSTTRKPTEADKAADAAAAMRGAVAVRERSDIAVMPDRPITVADDADYTDVLELIQRYGAVDFPGSDVVDKLDLLGVPFVILAVKMQMWMPTRDTFRPFRDYMSMQIITADADTIGDQIRRGRVLASVGKDPVAHTRLEDLRVKPQTRYIINDGSTGIRRQMTAFMDALGIIAVGHEDEARFNGNPSDESRRFDLTWNEWANPFPLEDRDADRVPQSRVTSDGTQIPEYGSFPDMRPLIVRAPRGLSGSFYVNEYAPDGATTFYVR